LVFPALKNEYKLLLLLLLDKQFRGFHQVFLRGYLTDVSTN
jgi:hypothetical protein